MPGYSSALFTSYPGARFECSICLDILKNPQVVCKNGHSFCESCIAQANRISKKCPTCREKTTDVFNNIIVRDIIGNLEVRCNVEKESCCSWRGTLESRDRHIANDCLLVKVPCPHAGCQSKPMRKGLAAHMSSCAYRTMKCSACSEKFVTRDLDAHKRACIARTVTCTLNCGAQVIYRSLATHKTVCPNALVQCPLKLIGTCGAACCGKVARRSIDSHVRIHGSSTTLVVRLIYNNLYLETCNQVHSLQFTETETETWWSTSKETVPILLKWLKQFKQTENWEGIKKIHDQLNCTVNHRGDQCITRYVAVEFDVTRSDSGLYKLAQIICLTSKGTNRRISFSSTNNESLMSSSTVRVCSLMDDSAPRELNPRDIDIAIPDNITGFYYCLFTILIRPERSNTSTAADTLIGAKRTVSTAFEQEPRNNIRNNATYSTSSSSSYDSSSDSSSVSSERNNNRNWINSSSSSSSRSSSGSSEDSSDDSSGENSDELSKDGSSSDSSSSGEDS